YDFLRQEHIIRANMAEPLLRRQVPRALGWALDYQISGALYRVLLASWRFGFVLIHFQMLLLWWLALPVVSRWLGAHAVTHFLGMPIVVGAIVGIATAVAIFFALRRLADRLFVIQINSHWPYLCRFARGEATCFDAPIEACAQRVVAAAHASEV